MREVHQMRGRMTQTDIPDTVLTNFGISSDDHDHPQLLAGGEGTTYLIRLANLVLKPARDTRETEIISDITSQIDKLGPHQLFRISKPIRSSNGAFTAHDWSASTFIRDYRSLSQQNKEYTLPIIAEILEVSAAFHSVLAKVILPDSQISYLRYGIDHVWAHAHRAVWSGATDPEKLMPMVLDSSGAASTENEHGSLIHRIIGLSDHLSTVPAQHQHLYQTSSQIVHGDVLSGDNVLFHFAAHDSPSSDSSCQIQTSIMPTPPALIDLSPTFAPAAYAEGIILADALIWCGVGLEVLDLTSGPTMSRIDMLRRGLLFRCLSCMGLVHEGYDAAQLEIIEIDRVCALLEKWLADRTPLEG